jgi:hypothetical protein
VRGCYLRAAGVVVQHTSLVTEPVLDLGADDRGDLLRRP